MNKSIPNKHPFGQLLIEQCSGIARKVSEEMQPNRFHVGSAKPSLVSDEAILYRWWFPEKSPVLKVIRDSAKKDKKLAALLEQVETCEINGKTYYALYFGKSNNGRHRYSQHTTGNVHISTIRHTVYGLCISNIYDKAREEEVSKILDDCYYEWISFADEPLLVECVEGICIALGKYPLNVDGNPAISDKWREHVMNSRKLKNNP